MTQKILIFLTVFLSFNSHTAILYAQKVIPNSRISGVCYGSGVVKNLYIPPPKEFFEKKNSKGLASITFNYTGFSTAAITAMERAGAILQSILPPDITVTISATWEKLSDANVLAQTVVTGYVLGADINAQKPRVLYPVALAEKIAGKKLNEDATGDIFLSVNSSIKWYLGTDGNPSTSQYDLITVAIHEICHGLGFFDSMYTENNAGGYGGTDSIPMIYDTFLEDNSGKRLIDTTVYTNPSSALKDVLTGGQLWFIGPVVRNYRLKLPQLYTTPRVKLYAPAVWDAGSSVSHLDEQATADRDALMTPFIGLAEVIHNPGQLTRSILGDLGWINTKIIHLEVGDTEEHISLVNLNLTVKSDTSYNKNRVSLVYSLNNFLTRDTVIMTPAAIQDTYTATVHIPGYESSLKYYFFAQDVFGRVFNSPSYGQVHPYDVYIGTDVIAPVVFHSAAEYYFQSERKITLRANATDNIGVDTVYVEYRKNSGPSKLIGMKVGKGNLYTTDINLIPEQLNGGDTFQYRIFAVDKSSRKNVAVSPATGFYSVRIERVSAPAGRYTTDFTNAASDFFNIGFEIAQPANFNSPGLHTKHPYAFSGRNDKNIEYTAMLRTPVIFDPNGMIISYREVALVEPGEPGSVFGSPNFYDYVILQVSTDFGASWLNLINGYDCRYNPEWQKDYNSSIDANGNSTYAGNESIMATHTIFPVGSDSISYGDTLLFRFKLFSDPLAVGWGWAIDDLKIGPLIDNIEDVSSGSFVIYPNPGNGLIKIGSINENKPVRFNVFNSAGTLVIDDYINVSPGAAIDISNLPQGFYFIRFHTSSGLQTIKYSLIR